MHADRFYGSPNFETPILQAIAITFISGVQPLFRLHKGTVPLFCHFWSTRFSYSVIPHIHTHPYISIKVPEEVGRVFSQPSHCLTKFQGKDLEGNRFKKITKGPCLGDHNVSTWMGKMM